MLSFALVVIPLSRCYNYVLKDVTVHCLIIIGRPFIKLQFFKFLQEAVKLIWFRFLKYSGYAFKNSAEPDIRTMHEDLPERKLRSNRLRPSSEVTDDTTKSHGPKRKQSFSLSEVKAAPKKKKSEAASSGDFHMRRKIDFDVEIESNKKKSIKVTQTVVNVTPELYYFDHIDTAGNYSNLELESETENKPFTPDQPLSKVREIQSLFEESSVSDEKESVTNCPGEDDNSRQEVDKYYMFLKKQDSSHMSFLTLKHTLAICYLGLLYTQQNVLLSDFAR